MFDLKKFKEFSNELHLLGKKISWPIPCGADIKKGDYGLLPVDTTIRAWQIAPRTAEFLRFLILITKSKTILELGTSLGFSALWLCLGAQETGGHVYGTENFPDKAKIAKKNITQAGLSSVFTLYEKDITEVLESWQKNKKIDFVFLDADKQRYHNYFDLILPLLSDNGIIVADNASDYPEFMEKFLAKLDVTPGIVVSYADFDHGLLLITKSSAPNTFIASELLFKP